MHEAHLARPARPGGEGRPALRMHQAHQAPTRASASLVARHPSDADRIYCGARSRPGVSVAVVFAALSRSLLVSSAGKPEYTGAVAFVAPRTGHRGPAATRRPPLSLHAQRRPAHCTPVRASACVCVCARACACARARVRVCVRARVRARVRDAQGPLTRIQAATMAAVRRHVSRSSAT